MNINEMCNECMKESVCKYKEEYEADCKRSETWAIGRTTQFSIRCKEFLPTRKIVPRELQNG